MEKSLPSAVAESPGIGVYAETSLHASVKLALSHPGDRQEAKVDGRVVDLLKADGEIVEVQTGNFGKIKEKIRGLSAGGHRVRVVYPVAQERYIVKLDPSDGHELARRKSPKRGSILSLFDELVYFPDLLDLPGVSLEVILLRVEELRCADGKGSWRRRFQSILDRRMTGRGESRVFRGPSDLLELIPGGLPGEFTATELAEALSCKPPLARKILYCLRKLGLAAETGKRSRSLLWSLKPPPRKGRAGRRAAPKAAPSGPP